MPSEANPDIEIVGGVDNAEKGWEPVVAPELEFFLTKVNEDPDYPLVPPIGRSRRQDWS